MTAPVTDRPGGGLQRAVVGLFTVKGLVLAGCVAVVGYLALAPLGFLFGGTFTGADGLTLENFRAAYASRFGFGSLTWDTLRFTVGSTAVALPIGTGLAYLHARTNVPLRRAVPVVALVPLIIPGILHTISWMFLASPRIGLLNTLLEPVLGPGFLDIFSMAGMSFVEGLHTAPIVFLVMLAAFRSVDPSLEEAALLSGAGRWDVVRRVTLPMVAPGIGAAVLLLVVNGLSSFEVPALLGIPSGIWVFTSRIWRVLSSYPTDYGQAGAYAVSLLAITTVGVFLQSRHARRAKRFQTITGKGSRPRTTDLGPWRWIALGAVATYFLLAVLLPVLVLVYRSTQPFYAAPSLDTLVGMSLDNYRYILDLPQVGRAVRNSLLLGVGSATSVMLLTAVVSWIVVRTRLPGRWALDNLAFSPIIVPGLVLGVAVLFVYLRVPLPIYGTLWILFIAYATKYMPHGMRYASTSLYQIGAELEESAAVSGASWWQQFRRVTLPLIVPGLLSGWIYILVVSVRELSSSLLLYTPGNEVLSIVIWEQLENGQTGALAALGVMMILALTVLVVVGYRVGARFGMAAP